MRVVRYLVPVVSGFAAGLLVGWLATRALAKKPSTTLVRPALSAASAGALLPSPLNPCGRTSCENASGHHEFSPIHLLGGTVSLICEGDVGKAGCYRARGCLLAGKCTLDPCSCGNEEPASWPTCEKHSDCPGAWCSGGICMMSWPHCSGPGDCPSDSVCLKVRINSSGDVTNYYGVCPSGAQRSNPPPDFPRAECRCVPS